MPYYVVKKGRTPGIYNNWNDCKEQVFGFSKPVYKKFTSIEEAKDFYSSNPNDIKLKSLDHFFKITTTQSNKDEIQKTLEETPFKKDPNHIIVYTDGACTNNGKKNAKAGIGVYFDVDDSRNCSERILGNQTNQHAELLAIAKALNILNKELTLNKKITIYTDSSYSIKCITEYSVYWCRDGWKKKDGNPIKNIDAIKNIYSKYITHNIHFKHIKSHTNLKDVHSIGNSKADELATKSIK